MLQYVEKIDFLHLNEIKISLLISKKTTFNMTQHHPLLSMLSDNKTKHFLSYCAAAVNEKKTEKMNTQNSV